jgi:hypothetical protein
MKHEAWYSSGGRGRASLTTLSADKAAHGPTLIGQQLLPCKPRTTATVTPPHSPATMCARRRLLCDASDCTWHPPTSRGLIASPAHSMHDEEID